MSSEAVVKKLSPCALSMLAVLGSMAWADAPADLSGLQANAAVSVREGDTWSPATFERKEGRKFLIKYSDGTEEWVTADRIKPGGEAGSTTTTPPTTPPSTPVAPPKSKVANYPTGTEVEAKSNAFWNPAKVINRRGDWYLLEWTKFGKYREWVEPWRIRTPGSDYDLKGWYSNPRVRNGEDPPRATPGEPTDDRDRPADSDSADGKSGANAEQAKKKGDVFGPPDNGVALTEATRGGRAVLPVAEGPWAYVPAAGPHLGMIAPTILPPLGAQFAKYDTLRIVGGTAIMPVASDFAGEKHTGVVRLTIATNSTAAVELNAATAALAVSPSGQLVAGRSNGFFHGAKSRLDVYKITGKKATPVVSFFPNPASDKADIDDIIFVDEKTVLTVSGDELASWDFATATCQWAMPVKGKRLARSPDGKSVAAVTADGAVILDPAAGKVLGTLDSDFVPGDLDFSADGKRLLGTGDGMLTVWDLTTGQRLYTLGLPAGVAGPLAAIDSDFALIGPYLFDLNKKCPLWKYETQAPMAAAGGRVFSVYTDGKMRMLVSAQLPQPSAAAAAKAAKEAQMLVKPGSSVALDLQIDATDDQKQAALAAITRKLEAGGVKIDPASPIKLVARTDSKNSNKQYTFHGPMFQQHTENVTLTLKTTTLSIVSGDKTLWSVSRSAGNDPGFLVITHGETVQQHADKANANSGAWIADAPVPTLVAAPVDLNTLPVSHWAMGGVKDR